MFVVMISRPSTLLAQSTDSRDYRPPIVRLEAGLGAGIVGEGGGLNARLSLMYLPTEWGLLVRATLHDGGDRGEVCGFLGCSTPSEEFHDLGILLVRHLGSRFTVATGVAAFGGRRFTDDAPRLQNFGRTASIPVEVGVFTLPPGSVGGGVVLVANLNKEASQVGLTATFTFGRRR